MEHTNEQNQTPRKLTVDVTMFDNLVKQRDDLLTQVAVKDEQIDRLLKRDGNWIDDCGACRVCGGEIPHGHTNECDIYKMEQQITVLRDALTKFASGKNWRCINGMSCWHTTQELPQEVATEALKSVTQ